MLQKYGAVPCGAVLCFESRCCSLRSVTLQVGEGEEASWGSQHLGGPGGSCAPGRLQPPNGPRIRITLRMCCRAVGEGKVSPHLLECGGKSHRSKFERGT